MKDHDSALDIHMAAMGYDVEDSGGGCCAYVQTRGRRTERITRVDDPSCPASRTEPIRVGIYDENDHQISLRIFPDGIAHYIKAKGETP